MYFTQYDNNIFYVDVLISDDFYRSPVEIRRGHHRDVDLGD